MHHPAQQITEILPPSGGPVRVIAPPVPISTLVIDLNVANAILNVWRKGERAAEEPVVRDLIWLLANPASSRVADGCTIDHRVAIAERYRGRIDGTGDDTNALQVANAVLEVIDVIRAGPTLTQQALQSGSFPHRPEAARITAAALRELDFWSNPTFLATYASVLRWRRLRATEPSRFARYRGWIVWCLTTMKCRLGWPETAIFLGELGSQQAAQPVLAAAKFGSDDSAATIEAKAANFAWDITYAKHLGDLQRDTGVAAGLCTQDKGLGDFVASVLPLGRSDLSAIHLITDEGRFPLLGRHEDELRELDEWMAAQPREHLTLATAKAAVLHSGS